MISIEPVSGLGQIAAGGDIPLWMIEQARSQAPPRSAITPVQKAAALVRAREERIKAEEVVLRAREPSTPLEVEARRRVTTYRAESRFQSNRRRFEDQLRAMPFAFKLKVRELMKAHDNYENLPGYSEFAAGRTTVVEMRAGLEAQHDRLKEHAEAQRAAWRAEFDARDDRMQQQIEQERSVKAAMKLELMQQVALREQAVRDRAREKQAEKKAAADAKKAKHGAMREAASDKRKTAFEIEKAAHPFQEGSPPVSAAIKIVAEQMGIEPGSIPLKQYLMFRFAVFEQAKKERGRFYYYKPGSRSSKYRYGYSIKKPTITTTLTREGYFALPAVVKQAAPRPAQPVRTTRTVNANDPVILEAIRQALAESGLISGSQIDVAAFERMVTAKAADLTRTTGKIARPVDIQSAVRSRVITSLRGMAM